MRRTRNHGSGAHVCLTVSVFQLVCLLVRLCNNQTAGINFQPAFAVPEETCRSSRPGEWIVRIRRFAPDIANTCTECAWVHVKDERSVAVRKDTSRSDQTGKHFLLTLSHRLSITSNVPASNLWPRCGSVCFTLWVLLGIVFN